MNNKDLNWTGQFICRFFQSKWPFLSSGFTSADSTNCESKTVFLHAQSQFLNCSFPSSTWKYSWPLDNVGFSDQSQGSGKLTYNFWPPKTTTVNPLHPQIQPITVGKLQSQMWKHCFQCWVDWIHWHQACRF